MLVSRERGGHYSSYLAKLSSLPKSYQKFSLIYQITTHYQMAALVYQIQMTALLYSSDVLGFLVQCCTFGMSVDDLVN